MNIYIDFDAYTDSWNSKVSPPRAIVIFGQIRCLINIVTILFSYAKKHPKKCLPWSGRYLKMADF